MKPRCGGRTTSRNRSDVCSGSEVVSTAQLYTHANALKLLVDLGFSATLGNRCLQLTAQL